MNWTRQWALLALCIAHSPALAGDHSHGILGKIGQVPDCVGKWCCDDYCQKNAPCVPVCLKFCPDNYCAKQEPCVCVPLCLRCDDYCAKCLPPICFPVCRELKCVALNRCVCGGNVSPNLESPATSGATVSSSSTALAGNAVAGKRGGHAPVFGVGFMLFRHAERRSASKLPGKSPR